MQATVDYPPLKIQFIQAEQSENGEKKFEFSEIGHFRVDIFDKSHVIWLSETIRMMYRGWCIVET